MARLNMTKGGRRSGWAPERSGHPRPRRMTGDDAILTLLWVTVLIGLLLLGLASLTGRLRAATLSIMTAEAAQLTPSEEVHFWTPANEGTKPESPLAFSAIGASNESPHFEVAASTAPKPLTTIAGRPVSDVSESSGVVLGRVVEVVFHSEIMGMELPYRAYLPAGYDTGSDRYPVLYLLHGNGASLYTEWTEDLRIGVVADAMIAGGMITPMIIVMPDGEHSYFMNQYGTGERWQDYLLDEFVPYIDEHFRTIPEKGGRGIAGHSMGGVGALAMAFSRPEMFGSVSGHSPSLRLGPQGGPDYFGPPDYFARYNPLDLAAVADGLGTLRIWVDFGESDYWLEDGSFLLSILRARGIEPYWRVSPGDHWASYWIGNAQDYLRFHSEQFLEAADQPVLSAS